MTVDVSTETVIDRPRDEVAAFAGDPSNAPQWYANIRAISWQTEQPLRVGSRMEFVASDCLQVARKDQRSFSADGWYIPTRSSSTCPASDW